MRLLADETCDFVVVTALRTGGHDVTAIVEIDPGAEDEAVLALARSEGRVLPTEDKDFGAGVRSALGQTIVDLVTELGDRLSGAFVVVEPGRARLSRPRFGDGL